MRMGKNVLKTTSFVFFSTIFVSLQPNITNISSLH